MLPSCRRRPILRIAESRSRTTIPICIVSVKTGFCISTSAGDVGFDQPPLAVRERVFRAAAARMSAFKASSSTLSRSRKSIARRVLPSRLELKRPEGSAREAPLANVSFTTFL